MGRGGGGGGNEVGEGGGEEGSDGGVDLAVPAHFVEKMTHSLCTAFAQCSGICSLSVPLIIPNIDHLITTAYFIFKIMSCQPFFPLQYCVDHKGL